MVLISKNGQFLSQKSGWNIDFHPIFGIFLEICIILRLPAHPSRPPISDFYHPAPRKRVNFRGLLTFNNRLVSLSRFFSVVFFRSLGAQAVLIEMNHLSSLTMGDEATASKYFSTPEGKKRFRRWLRLRMKFQKFSSFKNFSTIHSAMNHHAMKFKAGYFILNGKGFKGA